jgi:hypothetical protein
MTTAVVLFATAGDPATNHGSGEEPGCPDGRNHDFRSG